MYGESFGTDWTAIDDRDEVVLRAYALGVAARLGEEWPDELDRLATQVQTAYDRSFVDLAYRKGRDEAAAAPVDDDEQIWEELVEEKTTINPLERDDDRDWDDRTEDTTLPDALERAEVDTLPPDSTQRVSRPSFLERDRDSRRPSRNEERTVFGRPVSDVRSRRSDDEASDDSGEADGDDEFDSPSESTADGDDATGASRDVDTQGDRSGDDEPADEA